MFDRGYLRSLAIEEDTRYGRQFDGAWAAKAMRFVSCIKELRQSVMIRIFQHKEIFVILGAKCLVALAVLSQRRSRVALVEVVLASGG